MNAFFGDFVENRDFDKSVVLLQINAFFGDFSFKKYLFFRSSDIFWGFSFNKVFIFQEFGQN
jgi:hypothetical protein